MNGLEKTLTSKVTKPAIYSDPPVVEHVIISKLPNLPCCCHHGFNEERQIPLTSCMHYSRVNAYVFIPLDAYALPASLGEGASEKEVIYILINTFYAHNTVGVFFIVKISSPQHCLGIQAIYKGQPGEELNTWRAL